MYRNFEHRRILIWDQSSRTKNIFNFFFLLYAEKDASKKMMKKWYHELGNFNSC